MNLTFTDNHITVQTTDPAAKRILKDYHNAVEVKKGYRLPKHIWSMRELMKTFPNLKEHQNLLDLGQSEKSKQIMLLASRALSGSLLQFDQRLRPYQRLDVGYLTRLPSAGIFNEPRTGKTPTTITLLKELGLKRNLIIAPASLIWNWAKEFETWWPEVKVVVVAGTKAKREDLYRYIWSDDWRFEYTSAVLIISKDTLKSDSLPHKFDTCIVDEAHFLRNYKTAQSKAVFSIKADRRYTLTGTPTMKHPSDIYGILHFLDPKQFSSYWQFVDRYFEIGQDWMGHQVVGDVKKWRLRELQELVGFMSVQRTRKEVMPWLPEKQRSTITLRLDGKQQKLYGEMAKFFTASDERMEVDTSSIITQLMRLRQLCLDPRLLGFDTPGVKTEALLEYLENHKEPIVIMSWFTSYLKLLKPLIEKLNLKVGFVHGELDGRTKQANVLEFQKGSYDVLLCNIISAGTGFTLDRSSCIIFTDRDFTPALNDQAEDRVTATNQDRNTGRHEIITFTCADTVDERINDILDRKESLTEYINRGGAEAIKKLLGR